MDAQTSPRQGLLGLSQSTLRNRSDVLVIVGVLAWTIWFALGSPRLWDRDEPRNARCAVEMIERNDWIVPMFNDELRTHKPIALYWMQIASYTLFGINEFAARFGSALCGSASVVALYWFGRRHLSAQTGLWAAIALASCFMFVVASRAATPDAVLVATSTLGILLVASGQLLQGDERQKLTCNVLGYVALGAAVLAKGPVGVVIPVAVLGSWQFLQIWQNRSQQLDSMRIEHVPFFKTLLQLVRTPSGWWSWLKSCGVDATKIAWTAARQLHLLRGAAIVLAVALPWYVWVGLRTDGRWLYGFFVEHNVQRAMSSMEGHSGGLWYYPMAILFGTFPWSLMLIPILIWTARNLRNKDVSPVVELAVIWVVMTITAFSCAGTKLPSYITTCYPAAALLIGGFFVDWQNGRMQLRRYLSLLACGVMAVVGTGMCVAMVVVSICYGMPKLIVCAPVSLLMLLPAVMLYRGDADAISNRFRNVRAAHAFALAAISLVGATLGLGPAVVSEYRADLDQLVAAARADGVSLGDSKAPWLAIGTLDPSWVYYLEHPIKEFSRDGYGDIAWQTTALKHLRQPNARLIVTEADARQIESLWSQVDSSSKLVPMVEFSRFLKDEPLVVLRTVPADAATRVAKTPVNSNQMQR